ncbi:MAG: Rrf2 family transcriptional regulator [Bacteroidetes bacterium]|nr:Rrf2 family transcriptional regulator [Bacteroidota bacterium]
MIEIAHGTEAPIHFISKIMQALSRRKLVLSVKGPNGGFFMTEKENQTSLSEIVKVLTAIPLYGLCTRTKACSEKTSCPMHSDYKSIKANIIHLIEFNTIGSIQKRMDMRLFFTKKEQNNFL